MAHAVCDANLPEQVAPNPSGRRLDVAAGATSPTVCTYNSPGTPYGRIADAARCAAAGDTVYVHAGTYHGRQSLRNLAGAPGAWILITKAPGESGPVVFTGGSGASDQGAGVIDIYDSRYVALGPGFDIGNGVDSRGVNVVAEAVPVHHVVVFGNTVHDNQRAGVFFGTLPEAGRPPIYDVGAFGNTLYENATANRPTGGGFPNGAWSGSGVKWPASLTTGEYGKQSCIHFRRNQVFRSYGECVDQQDVDEGTVMGNVVHQCFNTSIYLDGSRNIRVDGNYVYESDGSFFVRAPDGSALPPVSILMGVEGGSFLHTGHVIANNIVHGARGITYDISNGVGNSTYGNVTIAHNTIVRPWAAAIDIRLPPLGQLPVAPSTLANNIAFGASPLSLANPEYWTIHNNDFPGGRPAIADVSNVVFYPLLAGPTFGDPASYKLTAPSPAFHAGSGDVYLALASDYFGATRSATAPSIGADEGGGPGAPRWQLSATVSPVTFTAGKRAKVIVSVTNNGAELPGGYGQVEVMRRGGGLPDEVITYCNGPRIAGVPPELWLAGGGVTSACVVDWETAEPGRFSISAGVFDSSWNLQPGSWADGLATVIVTPPPTFASSATATPASVATGATARITATVTNTSAVRLVDGIVTVEVYRPGGAKGSLGSCERVNIAPSASATCSIDWSISSGTWTGNYIFIVGVSDGRAGGWVTYHRNDAAGSVVVTNPASPFTSLVSLSPEVIPRGTTCTLNATVTNLSTTADLTNGIIYVQVYNPSGSLVSESSCAGVNIARGTTTSCSFSWTAPSTAGTYAIKLGLFGAGWTPQHHWNNLAGAIVVLDPSVTFASSATASPASVTPDGTSTLAVTVTNTSGASLNGGNIYMRIFSPSGDLKFEGACEAVTIAAGASTTCSRVWRIQPYEVPRTYEMFVMVLGAAGQPHHWRRAAATVTVTGAPPPPFAAAAAASPASVETRNVSTVTATVTNRSAVGLANGIIHVEVYDEDTTRVWQGSCGGVSIASQASATCTFAWTAPSTPGTYTVRVGVLGAGWAPLHHWNGAAASVAVTSGASASALAARLGKPPRLLIGVASKEAAWVEAAGIASVGIVDHYLSATPQDSWLYWNTDGSGAGAFITRFAAEVRNIPGAPVPMVTPYALGMWHEWDREHDPAYSGLWNILADGTFMANYWDSIRIMFERLGALDTPVLVNIEPDFWGYAHQLLSSDPAAIFANVRAEAGECRWLPNHVAGMAECYLKLARRLAPKAVVGFMPSRWADPTSTMNIANFMRAALAGEADFIAVETSDRDAGCYELRAQNCQNPGQSYWTGADYDDHFAMADLFHRTLGKPLVWWQTPFGVEKTEYGSAWNYRDNHVQTFFSFPERLVSAGGAAMVFGAGVEGQTHFYFRNDAGQVWTDGGHFKAYLDLYNLNPEPLP